MSTEEKDDRLETPITIPVRLDAATFRRFALFDAFLVKRHWIRPALFAALFVAFAAAALSLRKAQSGLIAAVLLAVGLGLPVVYAGSFLSQANAQTRDRLDPSRLVYTVILETDGVRVEAPRRDEEMLSLSWEHMQAAYRRKKCVYLYITPSRVLLLPQGQSSATDEEMWRFIQTHIGDRGVRSL